MSHFSKIKTKIVEQEYLLQALEDLGFHPQVGDFQVSGFAGQKLHADVKVSLRLSYDIGFSLVDGTYEIVADWYGVRGVDKNKFVQQVSQRYAYHAAKSKLEAQGFTLVEEKEEKGQIRLVLRRMA